MPPLAVRRASPGPYFFGRSGLRTPEAFTESPPTLADLDALPGEYKGEIIEGVLYTTKRPRASDQRLGAELRRRISAPFETRSGEPDGWWILVEPAIELPNSPEIAPDVAGWRRDRLPELPCDGYIRTVPNWVCEILTPFTRRYNLLVKKDYYARLGVPYLWLADRAAGTLTTYQLEGGHWVDLGTYADEIAARIPPFEAAAIDIKGLWD